MLTVHHLERSRSHRVLWLLEELGAPYEIVRYARNPKIDRGFTDPNLDRHLAFLEAELADRPWLCGAAITIADVQMSYPVEAALARGGAGRSLPNLTRYLERLRARPAYARALEKGGPILLD